MRWIGFVLGLVIVGATWHSIITTIIVPRSITSRITYYTWIVVQRLFFVLARLRSHYADKDGLLALLGPVSLLVALISWMFLFLLGFALLFWPLIDGDFTMALRLAGSSFFTLGVVTSTLDAPLVLEFTAAATGMTVVALQIGYLPTIYSAYNRRETLVTALGTRAGVPAWGPEVLARHQLNNAVTTLPALFAAWESWAADITESHVSYPWLISFRSPDPLHAWVVSLLAVLDAAALYLALAPKEAPPEARQCLRAGYIGLQTLARVAGVPVDADPLPDAPLDLTYDAFLDGVTLLAQAGFPIDQGRAPEEAWRHFRGWRVNYEAAAYALADFSVAVPAPWSGKRQQVQIAETVDALANRPRHRTPDDPEGLASQVRRTTAMRLASDRPREADAPQEP